MRGVLALLALLALAGCGSGDSGRAASSGRGGLEGSITVSAAASLTEAFTEIGHDVEGAHPGVKVAFNFDSSSILATQIRERAPADVFASADELEMDELRKERLVSGRPRVFARNEMVIVTKPGNPDHVRGLADLADVGVVALCAATAPCGEYAGRVLDRAGVSIAEGQVTRAQNATATLTGVTDGDAVAGIVYASDARRAGARVTAVRIPVRENVTASYPIVVLRGARDRPLADAFVAGVLSPRGQAVLRRNGFRAAS